jgi:hypothetical protein
MDGLWIRLCKLLAGKIIVRIVGFLEGRRFKEGLLNLSAIKLSLGIMLMILLRLF